MRTTVSSRGQIVLPAEIRQQDNIASGQQFEVERVKEGEYILKKLTPPKLSIFEWFQSCPEKGWFQPILSESTDTLFRPEEPDSQ